MFRKLAYAQSETTEGQLISLIHKDGLYPSHALFVYLFFETGFHSVAQTGLEFTM